MTHSVMSSFSIDYSASDHGHLVIMYHICIYTNKVPLLFHRFVNPVVSIPHTCFG